MRCNPPNSAFEEVSLPVSATPSHPINVPKNGKNQPVRVNARPSTASIPEYRVTYPNPSMHDIAIIANRMRYTVFPKIWKSLLGFNPRMVPASSAARKHPDPVDVNQLKSNFAFSAVGFATTGCAPDTALCKYGKSHPPPLNAGVVTLFIARLIVRKSNHKNCRQHLYGLFPTNHRPH